MAVCSLGLQPQDQLQRRVESAFGGWQSKVTQLCHPPKADSIPARTVILGLKPQATNSRSSVYYSSCYIVHKSTFKVFMMSPLRAGSAA